MYVQNSYIIIIPLFGTIACREHIEKIVYWSTWAQGTALVELFTSGLESTQCQEHGIFQSFYNTLFQRTFLIISYV
jgi:hypothetical protein